MLCILLALLLLASISASALAEGKESEANDPFVIDEPKFGFRFVTPEKYRNLEGSLDWSAQYLDDGILQFTPSYYCFPPEDFEAYNDFLAVWIEAKLADKEPPEAPDPRWVSGRESAVLFDFFIINDGRGEEELREELKEHNGYLEDNFTWLEKIGSDGEFSFFAGQYAELEQCMEEYREVMGEEYYNEFEELVTDRETFLDALTLSAPKAKQNTLEISDSVSFETTDLDGNPVNSKDLFAGSRVTMINLWATWCHACKKELPELAELAKEFEKNGCRIVGICLDADEEDKLGLAKEILEQNGVNYLNLVPPESVDELLPTVSFPTSFFFDSEGRMIVEPIRGAFVEQYLPTMNAALAQLDASAERGAEEIDYTTGTPWLDIDLEGNVTADTPADPKDNFALWANKDTILGFEIADGEFSASKGLEVSRKAERDTKVMFHGGAPENHDARLAYDYYYLITDWDARDALGVAPLKEMIDAVERIASLDDMSAYFVETPAYQRLYRLWKADPVQDPEDAMHNIISVKNAPFLLTDPAEYREITPDGETAKAAYAEYFEKMLARLGYSEEEAKQKFENCFLWETMLNAVRRSQAESRRSDYYAKTNNYYTRDELIAAAGNVPILETLEQEGYPAIDRYYVPEPAFLEKLSELYTEENLPLMRDYLILLGIREYADRLDWDSHALIETYSAVADGYPNPEFDKESYNDSDAYIEVEGALGWAMARLYAENYADPEDKARISEVVDEVVNAYYGVLEDADFISDETRANAFEKLDNLRRNVLYPDSWELYSYDGLSFASKEEGGNFWDAYSAIRKYEHDKAVSTFSEPNDRALWDYYPYDVNCFYSPFTNSIYIMAAFAQGSNYNRDMTDEELYGKIGSGVAHEISHAFDAVGAQYDQYGNFADWWTEEDYAAFLEKNEKLAAYYDSMHPWEGQDFDGERMKGEACADMGALRCILRIAAEKPDFDYDAFFRAYADRYACKEKLEMALFRLEDEHPMNYLRVNATLQQFDEFLNCYGITEGDHMYLAPEDRVAIW